MSRFLMVQCVVAVTTHW